MMKKNILKIFACVVVAMCIFACQDRKQQKLQELVNTFTEPVIIPNLLSIDSVKALPNFTLMMHVKWLQNFNVDFLREAAHTTCKNSLVRSMYTEPRFRELLDEGLAVCFSVSDISANHITDVYLTLADIQDDILNSSDEEYDIENIRQQFQMMQNTLPQKVDDGIIMYAINFDEATKTLEYTMTFEEGYDITYFASSAEDFRNSVIQLWKDNIRANEIIKEYISKGFVWKYVFIDNDNTVLVDVAFDNIDDLYR
ncbi:MAG: hypothetical protein LBH30_06720 [Prevotellaceae bacterium]|nr:hypothetical protein [Prevotellaceae bacterium]